MGLLYLHLYPLFTWSNRDTVVRIGLGYGLDDREIIVRFRAEQDMFLFSKASRSALGPFLPTAQQAKAALLPRVYDGPDLKPTIHST